MFDSVEKQLDERATLVDMRIECSRVLAGRPARDHGLATERVDGVDEVARVVRLVGDDLSGRHAFEERLRFGDVVRLSGAESQTRRVAETIDERVDLGRQPAARSPDRLLAVFLERRPRAGARE